MSQRNGDRLANAEFVRQFGPRLDQKYQLGAFLLAIDNRWRVLSTPRDKTYFGGQAFFAAVAAHVDDISEFDCWEYRLRRKKANFEVAWWQ